METKRTLTLGELIALFEGQPEDNSVIFDFGKFTPSGIDSYRGYYNHLALGYSEDAPYAKVMDVVDMLKMAVGKTFIGYKGGEFPMDLETPVWAANYGKDTQTKIVSLFADGPFTVIETAYSSLFD